MYKQMQNSNEILLNERQQIINEIKNKLTIGIPYNKSGITTLPMSMSIDDYNAIFNRLFISNTNWKKDCELNLLKSFRGSYFNDAGDFIADEKTNTYFIFANCDSELDVKCKVLEWLPYAACEREPYKTLARNNSYHTFILNGINSFLKTDFTFSDMQNIYLNLGKAINHETTIQFVENEYCMELLKDYETER